MADLLGDAAWANSRLRELLAERERLAGAGVVSGEPPQIDAKTALACRRQTEKVLAQGDAAERKRLVRTWVQEMKQAPGRLEVEITYRIPEPVMNGVVAGKCYVAIHNALASVLVRRWQLPRQGDGDRGRRRRHEGVGNAVTRVTRAEAVGSRATRSQTGDGRLAARHHRERHETAGGWNPVSTK